MNDLKALGKLFVKNPIMIITTLGAAAIGAVFGVLAYYNCCLG